MEIVIMILGIVVGLLIGFLVMSLIIIRKTESIGTLRVDHSLPDEGPYLFLELTKDVGYVERQKYIILKVNTDSYIPRK